MLRLGDDVTLPLGCVGKMWPSCRMIEGERKHHIGSRSRGASVLGESGLRGGATFRFGRVALGESMRARPPVPAARYIKLLRLEKAAPFMHTGPIEMASLRSSRQRRRSVWFLFIENIETIRR